MESLINKIKNLRNDGYKPCDASIEFLKSCKTPQEALDKASWDYLEWLLDALAIDHTKDRADYRSKRSVFEADYCSKCDDLRDNYYSKCNVILADHNSKVDVLLADYKTKGDAICAEYANSLRKLVPTSFFS